MGLRTRFRSRPRLPEVEPDPLGAAFEQRSSPDQMRGIRSANRDAALSWADDVRSGTMTRAEFDQITRQALRMGHLLAEDYEKAVARLGA